MHTYTAFCPQLMTNCARFYSNTLTSSPGPPNWNTVSTPASATAPTASASVIVFGFSPYLYHDIVQHFTSIGEPVSIDPAPSPEAGRNWITIVYKNPWEAARAVRRSGEILTIGREECMIGVKWAVSICSSEICPHFTRITESFVTTS
jgi:nuclear pore complex protein Nup53